MSLRRKRLREIRKRIQKLPKAQREQFLKNVRDNPHVCNVCCTGEAYFEGRLVCYCWPAEEMQAYERELNDGSIVLEREEAGIRYYRRSDA